MSKRSIVSMHSPDDKNKGARKFFGKRFLIPVSILCFALSGGASTAQVRVETGGDSFSRSGAVAVTIANDSPDQIYTAASSGRPEDCLVNFEKRKNQWVWDAFPLRCPRLECPGVVFDPQLKALEPGERCSFSWQPRIYSKGSLVIPGPGNYRLTVIYRKGSAGDPARPVWATAKSNEFKLE